MGAPVTDVSGDGESIVADGVAVASGFDSVILVRTPTNGGAAFWLEWIQPWLWSMFQTTVIDAPSMTAYSFWSLGLTWLWNGLSGEVLDMAKEHMTQKELEEIHEEHVPIVAPEEDFGLDAIVDDSDFAPDAGAACTGPECLVDGPDGGL